MKLPVADRIYDQRTTLESSVAVAAVVVAGSSVFVSQVALTLTCYVSDFFVASLIFR